MREPQARLSHTTLASQADLAAEDKVRAWPALPLSASPAGGSQLARNLS